MRTLISHVRPFFEGTESSGGPSCTRPPVYPVPSGELCRRECTSILPADQGAPAASQPTTQLATQPSSRPASMCPPVGWTRKVSESVRFRTKINTIWVSDHFRISGGDAAEPTFCPRVRIFDALFGEGYAFLTPTGVAVTDFRAEGSRFRRAIMSP